MSFLCVCVFVCVCWLSCLYFLPIVCVVIFDAPRCVTCLRHLFSLCVWCVCVVSMFSVVSHPLDSTKGFALREPPFSVIGKDGRFSVEHGPEGAIMAFKQQVYTQATGGNWDAIPIERKPVLSFALGRNSATLKHTHTHTHTTQHNTHYTHPDAHKTHTNKHTPLTNSNIHKMIY